MTVKIPRCKNLKYMDKIKLIEETPNMFWSMDMQHHMNKMITSPKTGWVQDIIQLKREQENIKLYTDEFVFLPDTKNIYKRWRQQQHGVCLNWMAIVINPALRNIRDLKQEHIPLLRKIKQMGIDRIKEEFPHLGSDDIMIYANYPPSIHTLHFHFCFPFFSASAYDAFRIHSIDHIINNLNIKPDYYSISTFFIPVHEKSPLLQVYKKLKGDDEVKHDTIPGLLPATFDLLSGEYKT